MITSLKVGDKFTVPEEFEINGAELVPNVVYTVVEASESKDTYSVEPGRGWADQWHFNLLDDDNNQKPNIFEPYPTEKSSVGNRLKDALEILKTAGPIPDFVLDGSPESFEAVAREFLEKAIRAQEAREAEEAEEKELKELALKLMNTNNKISGMPVVSNWSEVRLSSTKARWMSVAKDAKEFFSDK